MSFACKHKNATVQYTDKNRKTKCDQCCRHFFTDSGFGFYFCSSCGLEDNRRISFSSYSDRSADYNFFRKRENENGKTKCSHCNRHFSPDGGYRLCTRCRFDDYNFFRQVENLNDVPTAWLKHLKKTRDELDKKLTKIWIKRRLINKI